MTLTLSIGEWEQIQIDDTWRLVFRPVAIVDGAASAERIAEYPAGFDPVRLDRGEFVFRLRDIKEAAAALGEESDPRKILAAVKDLGRRIVEARSRAPRGKRSLYHLGATEQILAVDGQLAPVLPGLAIDPAAEIPEAVRGGIAPEVLQGETPDARTETWVVARFLSDHLGEGLASLPAPVRALIARALAPERRKRPGLGLFLAELRFLDSQALRVARYAAIGAVALGVVFLLVTATEAVTAPTPIEEAVRFYREGKYDLALRAAGRTGKGEVWTAVVRAFGLADPAGAVKGLEGSSDLAAAALGRILTGKGGAADLDAVAVAIGKEAPEVPALRLLVAPPPSRADARAVYREAVAALPGTAFPHAAFAVYLAGLKAGGGYGADEHAEATAAIRTARALAPRSAFLEEVERFVGVIAPSGGPMEVGAEGVAR